MEQTKNIDTLETYHPSYERTRGSHHRVSCMLIGLCIGGQERQKLLPSIEIDAYGIEGGPIYLNAMVGFYLNEH